MSLPIGKRIKKRVCDGTEKTPAFKDRQKYASTGEKEKWSGGRTGDRASSERGREREGVSLK